MFFIWQHGSSACPALRLVLSSKHCHVKWFPSHFRLDFRLRVKGLASECYCLGLVRFSQVHCSLLHTPRVLLNCHFIGDR